jgi:hypothetical protein
VDQARASNTETGKENTLDKEGSCESTYRGVTLNQLAVGIYAIVNTIYYYDITLISPLHYPQGEHDDTLLPTSISILIRTAEFSSTILQIIFNNCSGTFAGLYNMSAYLQVARHIVRLLQFWPWFIGRYEVRGGLGAITVIWIMLDGVMMWQAWTLPKVEQAVSGDDE